MTDIVRIKRRVTGSPGAPASLANAELAYNEVDHTLYYGEGTGGTGGSATVVVAIAGQGLGSSALPIMDGTAAAGSGSQWSRADHIHPVDTSRYAASNPSGYQTAAQVTTSLGSYAPLASPLLTGTPTAPTAANGTNTTQLATTAYVLAVRQDQQAPPGADVLWNGFKLTGLANPVSAQDATTKSYVDTAIQGLSVKPTATVATTVALPANVYVNGTAGVGATLTATANGILTVDGHAVAVNDIVLVKNEAAAANNGLYLCTTAGAAGTAYVLTRHLDMDTSNEMSGAFIPVGNIGPANANSLWLANPSLPITVGTTAIPFTQLNAATSMFAGNGISISANTITAVGVAPSITVGASGIQIGASYTGQSSITTLGTVITGVWNGTTIAVANGGTGATTLTGYVVGNGTGAFTAVASIPNSAITGLGTMAVQNANAVAITGGTIDNITIDGGTF